MKSRVVRYLFYTLLWVLVGSLLFIATERTQSRSRSLKISGLKIEVVDSTSHGQLVTSPMVEQWLKASKMKLQGCEAAQVDLQAIEELIARNGFVGRVSASIGYKGELHIRISQREPLFRLLVDGYNHYVTEGGYIFRAPERSSIYVPVITGSYRPPFPPDYEGSLAEHLALSEEQSRKRLEALEVEKYPLFEREKENIDYNRATRRMFTRQGLLESDEHFDKRVEELRALKRQRRRHYRYVQQQIDQGIDRISRRQESECEKQKKLAKNYQDFQNLITFVKKIDEDAFWRSEIVQFIASGAHSGALEVAFIPRSGAFSVKLGQLDGCDEKLELVEEFCQRGLRQLGWERFCSIDVSCRGQVICTEKE